MRDQREPETYFAILRGNSPGLPLMKVDVVKGYRGAERAIGRLTRALTAEQRENGVGYQLSLNVTRAEGRAWMAIRRRSAARPSLGRGRRTFRRSR